MIYLLIIFILYMLVSHIYFKKNGNTKPSVWKSVVLKNMRILLSPWVVLFSMIAGVCVGIYFKPIVPILKPFGQLYLTFLNMCIIPIVASAVLVSVSKLLNKKETRQYLGKIVVIFSIFTIATATIGIIAGLWNITSINNEKNNAQIQKSVGRIVLSTSSKDNTHQEEALATFERVKEIDTRITKIPSNTNKENQFIAFLIKIIPNNIFSALAEGRNLQIVFFFMILGIMTAFISHDKNLYLIGVFQGFFEAFQKLIKLAMYFLPLALVSLIGNQFLHMGYEILSTLLKLIITIYASSLIILIVSVLILWFYSKQSLVAQFKALKSAILVTIGTRSSFATLPFAISGMLDLGFEKNMTKLTISLSMALCKYGKTMLFCIASIFAAFLYDYELTLRALIIITVASIFAGIAGSGAPGIISRTMIALVLEPLGIPSDVIIALLLAIDPIVDPILTLVSTYPNYAASAIICHQTNEISQESSEIAHTYNHEVTRQQPQAIL